MNTHSKITFASLLITLGIVFGDIGTSPLYVLKAIVGKDIITEEMVLGGLSLIVWTLTLQATIKYIFIVLNADNKGEGGIFALYALVRKRAPKWALVVAMIGCSALLADGIITPAISLTSAIEGLEHYGAEHYGWHVPVVPIVIAIIFLLFFFQQFGTELVGKAFGPIMLVWFGMLAVLGFDYIMREPVVLKAVSPHYAFMFLVNHPNAMLAVGAVFLCVTGAEALYSDLGHCGKKNIQLSWILVKTCLIITYLGQGAWVLSLKGQTLGDANPFFQIMPEWFVPFGVLMATLASVVASQALISGSFSLINEALKLNCWFKVQINYPSEHKQQLYIPFINWMLMVGAIFVVVHFQASEHMEAAYGISITIAMLSTTTLLFFYLKKTMTGLRSIYVYLLTGLFLMVDGLFFFANAQKIAHGAGVTLILAAVFFTVMYITNRAKGIIFDNRKFVDIEEYANLIRDISKDDEIPNFATNIVYLTTSEDKALVENDILKSIYGGRIPKRANAYWLLHFSETDEPFSKKFEFTEIEPNLLYRVDIRLGFKIQPRVNSMFAEALAQIENEHRRIDLRSPYMSLRKYHIKGNFLFILFKSVFNINTHIPVRDFVVMQGYRTLSLLSVPVESHYGVDRNTLLLEDSVV